MPEKTRQVILTLNSDSLAFKLIKLTFIGKTEKNLFSKKNNKTVRQTLEHRRYSKLEAETVLRFPNKLDEALGEFLLSLKSEHDDFYTRFLNKYGDMFYEKFHINSKSDGQKKGVYMFMIANSIMYIGRCKDAMKKRINSGYGNISPKNCYLDGQSTNCRMNPLISSHKQQVSLWLYELDDNSMIESIEHNLIIKLDPPWNIKS